MTAGIEQLRHVHGIDVHVQRKRVRYLRLRVCTPDGSVRVSAPPQARDTEIARFVAGHIDWIQRQRERIAAQPAPAPPAELSEGSRIRRGGTEAHLRFGTPRPTTQPTLCNSAREIWLPVAPDASRAQRLAALHRWLRADLHTRIDTALPAWERVVGAGCSAWQIRNTRSRWGSCNATHRRLSFSLRLAAVDDAALDYVIVHELTHLLHANHSRAFWAAVAKAMPDWRAAHDRLRSPAGEPDIWR